MKFLILTIFIFVANSFSFEKRVVAEIGENYYLTGNVSLSDPSEVTRLVDWVYRTSIELEASERGIKVTDDDVRDHLDKSYGDIDSKLTQLQLIHSQLPPAWYFAKENPGKEKQIYESKLKGVISYSRWESYLNNEGGEESIRRLEQMSYPTKEDLYRVDDSFKSSLLEKKVLDSLFSSIEVSDEEISSEYVKLGLNKSLEESQYLIKRIITGEKKAKVLNEWMIKRMIYPNVIIHDKELNQAYERNLIDSKGLIPPSSVAVPDADQNLNATSPSHSSNEESFSPNGNEIEHSKGEISQVILFIVIVFIVLLIFLSKKRGQPRD